MKWSPAEVQLLRRLTTPRTMTWLQIAKQFPGRNEAQIKSKARELQGKTDEPLVFPSRDFPTDELVRPSPVTLDDLLAATKVDLAVWEVERWVANKWEVGTKLAHDEVIDLGDKREIVTTENIVTTPLYQIKAWFKKKSFERRTMEELRKGLLEDIRTESCRHEPVMYPAVSAPYLFEFSPFDLHLGKLAWHEETGVSYDAEKGEELFNASLDFLLTKALRLAGGKLDRILCVFGNDAMHVDSKRNQTTAGTQMDFDTRYIKVYRRLVQIHRRAVNILRQHAPVDVKIIPGNHDELTAFHMGEILATAFEGVVDVTVDNSPAIRKYYEYGINLFGFTHGDAEKVSELPLQMAREAPEMWARCSSREWHIGHLHKSEKWEDQRKPVMAQDFFSDKGIRVRRLTSLSGHDFWHTKHAYCDRRACEGFLFHKTAGFTDHISFNVDHYTGRVLSV